MNRRTKILLGTAAAAAIVGLGATGVATAADTGSDDSGDVALTGTDLERASEAALAATGGGEVVDSEVEELGYEVEVILDGRQIELQLDENFEVVSTEEDEEGSEDDD